MNLVILDLSTYNLQALDKCYSSEKNDIVLALTPSSFYYLELNNIEYLSFHNLISTEKFQKDVLKIYDNILNLNSGSDYFKSYFRDIAQYVCYYYYIDIIISYVKKNTFTDIYYITDKIKSEKQGNTFSFLYDFIDFTKVILIKKNNHKTIKNNIIRKYNIIKILKKIKNKLLKHRLNYDWFNLNPIVNKKNIVIKQNKLNVDISINDFKFVKYDKLEFDIVPSKLNLIQYMTFLTKDLYAPMIEYKKQNNKLYFFQHGSYLYENIFIKYNEIEPANINFVFNEYTKKLFFELGSEEVYSVGSILFNKPITEKKKKYDFLYITQGHDYLGNLQYVDFPNSLHSFDGYELYQRHKNIIELFGTKFKDKKIMIRVHPCIVTTGVYVPFWELAEEYKNITIDVSIPIHTLIEKSKYIISDYFTTEFINRELHYKRDIILFEGAPTPLPKETVEDMDKMFILVDTVASLEDKIENIESITKNRKRYDNIIEYYSSKKCDTKKVVTKILEKELNGR